MDKIAELCAAEQKYLAKLELVTKTYAKVIREAADPEIDSPIRLESYPWLTIHQHQKVFAFYEQMWDLHINFYSFWTHSPDDFLSADRCGQLFYHELLENRFDIYLQHIVGNPLRHSSVQEDFTAIIVGRVEIKVN